MHNVGGGETKHSNAKGMTMYLIQVMKSKIWFTIAKSYSCEQAMAIADADNAMHSGRYEYRIIHSSLVFNAK